MTKNQLKQLVKETIKEEKTYNNTTNTIKNLKKKVEDLKRNGNHTAAKLVKDKIKALEVGKENHDYDITGDLTKEGTLLEISEEYTEFVEDAIFNIVEKGYNEGLSLKEIKDIIINEVDGNDNDDEEAFDENEWIKSKVTNTGQMGGNDKERFNSGRGGTM